MTYEEALKIIKEHEAVISRVTGRTRFGNALYIAMHALERQIPKSVEKIRGVSCCPLCGFGQNNEFTYCHSCGQRLDWSEEK